MTQSLSRNLKSVAGKTAETAGEIAAKRKFYEDAYAVVSFVESNPCVGVTLSGVPPCSDHYKLVHLKLLQCIQAEIGHYAHLHLLTDNTKAGMALEEDLVYYKSDILPAIDAAGVRYHAIVLPQSAFARLLVEQTSPSTRKLKTKYFTTVASGCKWLRHC